MYIQPQTNIKLLHNVPLDTTYDHTIYFESASAQTSYFSGLVKYNLTNYSYQRVKKGVARVGVKSDNLYDCNYMMFQNSAFGTKWFYAFITSVEYVNNETSDVFFEMDVMQTWFFDFELEHCFVERIIHAVGPDFWRTPTAFKELFDAYYNSLCVLKDNDLHSISFPLISSGIFGGNLPNPVEESTKQCCRAYIKFVTDYPTCDVDVKLCAYTTSSMQEAQPVVDNYMK